MKVLATVFVALLAVNLSLQNPTQPLGGDTSDAIVEALNKVLNFTGILLDDVDAIIAKSTKESVNSFLVEVVTDIAVDINGLIISAVSELRPDATDDGKAVIDCVVAEQDDTNAALGNIVSAFFDCGSADFDDIFAEVQVVVGELRDLQDDVQGQVTTLSECTGLEVSCLVGFATTLIATVEKAVPIVKTDITDIYNLVAQFVSTIESCSIADSIKAEAQKIFDAGVVCIKS